MSNLESASQSDQSDPVSQSDPPEPVGLSGTHWAAVVLAAITGAIHVYLGIEEGAVVLLLAGLGFFGGLVLFSVGFHRRILYIVGIPYTLAQIALWLLAGMPDFLLGVLDKAVQILLVVALLYLYRRDRPAIARSAIDTSA